MRAVVLASLLASVLAGCKGRDNSCEGAVGNAAKIEGFGGATYAIVRAQAVAKCREDGWNEKMRTCVAEAGTRGDLALCERHASKGPIESYEQYMKKSKRSEAELNLNAIQKALKTNYVETAAFPVGSAPLTPSAPCCADPTRKCPVSSSEWMNNPIWDALYFELSEPSYFQYSYESTDGKVAIARAVGDLDCDTSLVTYELRCEAPNGDPMCVVTKPTTTD